MTSFAGEQRVGGELEELAVSWLHFARTCRSGQRNLTKSKGNAVFYVVRTAKKSQIVCRMCSCVFG